MAPCDALLHVTHGEVGDAELLADNCAADALTPKATNLPDIIGGKSGVGIGCAPIEGLALSASAFPASFGDLVLHVIEGCAFEDVSGVAARGIVATMQSEGRGKATVLQKEGDPMRVDVRHFHPHAPVSILIWRSKPRPATIRSGAAINPTPEPLISVVNGVRSHGDIVLQECTQ